ncbi:hypothetical protein [Aureivirga marina]|uniref:hypothetical protein n=1 Tax=Aureivirga marina TaxID=1182451 RepID=UPI0018CAAE7B|nr:hypothetical protein [Aureivirga marina]
MNKNMHCELCELQSFDFINGITCSLTKEKATFKNRCSKIQFGEKLEEKIVEINQEYENLKYMKKHAYSNLIFYSLIGIGVWILNYFITIRIFEVGVISTISLSLFLIGGTIIGYGTGAYKFYNSSRKSIIPKKEKLDNILKIYQISYSFVSEIKTNLIGRRETVSELNLNGKKTTFSNME